MEHARLSCSDTRWPHCPGSIRECEQYQDNVSEAAIDGTGSHELLELVLSSEFGKKSAKDYIGEVIGVNHDDNPDGWLIDEKRAKRVQVAVNYVKKRSDDIGNGVVILTEAKTNPGLKYGREDWWGTCDITIYGDGILEVIDYKDGFTHVEETTTQLISYAIGQSQYFAGNPIHLVIKTIIQPKSDNQIRSVEHTLDENDALGRDLARAAFLTDYAEAPLIPGDHCKWCNHIDNCSSRNELVISSINGPVNPKDMSPEQLSKANDVIPMVENFLKAVKKETENRISEGTNVPGYAMVKGRKSNMKWINEETALKRLKALRFKVDERTKSNIITPKQALEHPGLTEAQLENITKMITREEGKKNLKKVTKKKASELFIDTEVKKKSSLNTNNYKKLSSDEYFKAGWSPWLKMNDNAEFSYKEYLEAGWTNEQLIDNNIATWNE